jgi:acyl transferase domain-containing protein
MRSSRSVARYVVVALVALAVGAAGGVAFGMSTADDNADMLAPLSTVTAARIPTACSNAIARADSSIEVADRVAAELADHTKVMDDLIASLAGVNNGMTAHKALTQGMASINKGRHDRRVFAEAKARYADVKQACRAQ